MTERVRVEVKAKDSFWYQAFHVEWQDCFPGRELRSDGAGFFLVDAAWLRDMKKVGEQVFCEIRIAPQNPRRRAWFSSIFTTVNSE